MQVRAIVFFKERGRIFGDVPPHDRGRVADHRLEGISGFVGFSFLAKTQHGGKRDHQADDNRRPAIFSQIGNDRQQGQEQVEGIAVAVPQMKVPGQRFFVFDLVEAKPFADRVRLHFGQPVVVAVKLPEQGFRIAG